MKFLSRSKSLPWDKVEKAIINETGCFDLQFRRDVKHNRPNRPVYYGWKAQFVVMGKIWSKAKRNSFSSSPARAATKGGKEDLSSFTSLSLRESSVDEDLLRKIQNSLNCGRLHFVGENKIRYSVQDIDNLYNKVVPFFKKNYFSGNKKQDFGLWAKAIEILFQNKGKTIKEWKKDDFLQLIEIQKITKKYKAKKTQGQKWLSVAESISKAK